MAKPKQKSSSRLLRVVAGIWGSAIILGLLIVFLILRDPSTKAHASFEEVAPTDLVSSSTLAPSATLPPATPTLTPGVYIEETPELPIPPTSTPTPEPTSVGIMGGPIVIGYSVGGRPLEVYRFGNGPNAYMVIAGIHGGYEVNTVILADQLIAYYSTRLHLIPEDSTLYILRAMNADGVLLANQKEGRTNMNNVDLNRNFPVDWAPTWDRTGCWDYMETNSGAIPASEPETVAVMAFILEHPLVALVSYHAAAPGFYPSGDPPHEESGALARYLSKASGYPYPAIDTGCFMTGSLVDWVYTTGAAAVDLELSNHWETEFETNLLVVNALIRWLP